MKKILFATKNNSKLERYSEKLKERGIEVISLNDIDVDVDVVESANTAVENAILKAKAYYDATKIPTMAIDDTMYIEGIPDDKQPGVYVRRVNGKRLNDEEMIQHYTELVKKHGNQGKLKTKWILGLAIIKDGKTFTYEGITNEYYLSDKPTKERKEGYPLSSILINVKANKYDIYMTEEDKKIGQADDKGFIDFVDQVINQ